MDTTDKLLAERGKTYGDFTFHAEITQDLKRIMGETPGWQRLNAHQREALEMIQHKIGRILNGDPNYRDNWADIGGYARLSEERCTPKTIVKQIEAMVKAQVKSGPMIMHNFDYTDEATPYADKKQPDDVNGVSHPER